jgi:hypothetical protein
MADGKYVIKNPVLTVNGVDLTGRATSAEVSSEKDLVDATTFGANNKQNLLGLGDGKISIDFAQDFAAAMVDATLWPIHANSTEVVITVKPFNAANAVNNPQYSMTGVLPAYTPISGSVGDLSTVTAEFSNSGSAGITRATS